MSTPTAQPHRHAIRGPLDLGALLGATVATYRAQWKLYALLALVPVVVGVLITVVLALVFLAFRMEFATALMYENIPVRAIAIFVALWVAADIVQNLTRYWARGAMVTTTHALTEGYRLTFKEAVSTSTGTAGRLVWVAVLVTMGRVLLVGGLLAAVLSLAIPVTQSGGTGTAEAERMLMMLGIILVVALLVGLFVALPLWMYFGTSWLYMMPVATLERRGGFAALGRSSTLTKGEFWRTLGYYLVFVMISFAISAAANAPAQFSSPARPAVSEGPEITGVMVVAFVITAILSSLVQLVLTPADTIYVTHMYLDQLRRSHARQFVEQPAAPHPPTGPGHSERRPGDPLPHNGGQAGQWGHTPPPPSDGWSTDSRGRKYWGPSS